MSFPESYHTYRKRLRAEKKVEAQRAADPPTREAARQQQRERELRAEWPELVPYALAARVTVTALLTAIWNARIPDSAPRANYLALMAHKTTNELAFMTRDNSVDAERNGQWRPRGCAVPVHVVRRWAEGTTLSPAASKVRKEPVMYVFNEAQRLAVLEKYPHLSPSQLQVLASKLADLGEDVAAATSGEHAIYALEWKYIKKDPTLVRAIPTAAEYVAHKTAERKAAGLEVSALALAREAQELDASALLAAVPATSAALKAPPDVLVKRTATSTYDPNDQNALVRAFAEDQGETYRELLDAHGPTRAVAMARAWHQSKGKATIDERPASAQRPATGKAAADNFAASEAAAKMGPAARMTEYRRLLAKGA